MKIEKLGEMLAVLERERGVSKDVLLEAVKAALVSACKKIHQHTENLEADLAEDGEVTIFAKKEIVAEVTEPELQMTKAQAKKMGVKAEIGETVKINITPADFGRLAAQTAKQVIMQRLREAEKEGAFEEFNKKVGEIIAGTVQQREAGGYLVNLGRIETYLPNSDVIPGEFFHSKERVKILVVEVKKSSRGPAVVISRTHPNLVKKLFELEVPEILEGILEIKGISREAGRRTKIAVFSHDKNVAAVGTCVGQMGTRIQNIVRELGNEKVDIVEWNEDDKKFISNALSPAKIQKVKLDKESKTAQVVVPEDQLSLAIGKEGQNVRLAAKLTSWKIDIVSEKQDEAATTATAPTVKTDVKVKIFELAKKLDITSKEILAKAKELNIEAKAATSSITDADAEKLKNALLPAVAETAESTAASEKTKE
ncbi:MAG: transcription termination factor NusA [Candidatus Margulisiibacteriota bacterium]